MPELASETGVATAEINHAEWLQSAGNAAASAGLDAVPRDGQPAGEHRAARIMVVDDEPINVKVVCEYLKDAGFRNFIATSDSSQAMAAFQQNDPDLLLLDIDMPEIGGLEILRMLRAERNAAQLPVIILTAIEERAVKASALELGATDFLTKPVDPTDLVPRVLNALAAKAYHDRLQDSATELERQVQLRTAELLAANQSLEKLVQVAKAANVAKSEFLANMSHEIRTPMTAILGFSDLLATPNLPPSEQRDFLDGIRRNGRALLELINDILDLSRIEAEKLTLQMADCSLRQIIDDVASTVQIGAAQKKLVLETDYRFPLPATIHTDEVRLRQILVNLVSNAVKFTSRGRVRVTVRYLHDGDDAGRMQFAVSDTGIGIPADKIGQLFQPFTQVDGSASRRYGGMGLGLCISARLAKALGGGIEVTSEVGNGSTFLLTIQAGPPKGVGTWQSPHAVLTAGDEPFRSGLEPLLHGRLLLVEDSPDIREVLQVVLRKRNLEVEMAEDGAVACEMAERSKAEQRPYDLILMDIQMPKMNGYEATQWLREHDWQGPIVALTAHAMVSDREKCLAAGCDDYLVKPVTATDLRDVLVQYLAKL